MQKDRKVKQKKDATTSLKVKLTKIVASATDTEGRFLSPSIYPHSTSYVCSLLLPTAVHTILKDLLPPSTYFRFNPKLSEDLAIDESKPEKLDQLVRDANSYIMDNDELLRVAATCLTAKKKPHQRAEMWAWSQLNRIQSKLPVRVQK